MNNQLLYALSTTGKVKVWKGYLINKEDGSIDIEVFWRL